MPKRPPFALPAASLILLLLATLLACAQFESRDRRFYYRAPWNYALRENLPDLDIEFNGVDFGHAHLYETLLVTGATDITVVGTAAETSAVMLAYLDEACARRKAAGGLTTLEDLLATVHAGAVERIRPMAMIGLVDVLGLVPVMLATGTGADVMKRVAAPQVGGVFSAMILTLIVIPPIYVMWRWRTERRALGRSQDRETGNPPQAGMSADTRGVERA